MMYGAKTKRENYLAEKQKKKKVNLCANVMFLY